MKTILVFVERAPFEYDLALRFVSDIIEPTPDGADVYLDRERALRALTLLADSLGVAVYEGDKRLVADI